MQIVIYDFAGRDRHRSAPFAWAPPPQGATQRGAPLTALFWAPMGDRLFVHNFESDPRTGVYDLERDQLTLLEGAVLDN
jgi:hypothetical protein